MFRKFSSILFLALLLLHVAGFTLLTFWNSWESENNIELNQQIEIKGDSLIHKYPISLPYSSNFQKHFAEAQTVIYNGKFYQTLKVEYRNDTLLTYYLQANYTRENVLSIVNDFSDSLTLDLSKEKENSSRKALEFFKKITKDFFAQNLVLNNWFWIDFTTVDHFYSSPTYKIPNQKVTQLPPILKG